MEDFCFLTAGYPTTDLINLIPERIKPLKSTDDKFKLEFV